MTRCATPKPNLGALHSGLECRAATRRTPSRALENYMRPLWLVRKLSLLNRACTVLPTTKRHFKVRKVQKVEFSPMAYKIAGQRIEVNSTASAEDLKHVFETAVCEIRRSDLSTKNGLEYRAPIVTRARLLGISRASAEKRALYAAARALAQLWKV